MECPDCSRSRLVFRVPEELSRHAPDGPGVAICPDCLSLAPAADESARAGPPTDFSSILDGFPDGDAGAAMALGVGLAVDSPALHRAAIGDCLAAVSDAGADPWLVLERLAASGTVRPDADLDRVRRQLEQLLG